MPKIFRFLDIFFSLFAFLLAIYSCEADVSSIANVGGEIKTECACFLEVFAQKTQKFNLCAVKHAKPLSFCKKCTSQYTDLLERNPVKFNDSTCVGDLVKSERFQIVMKVYDFQTGLWDAANCNACYQVKWNLTKHATDFFYWLPQVQKCFSNYSEPSVNGTFNRSRLCEECHHIYNQLRKSYNAILDNTPGQNEDRMCADIMSAMNDTRRDWRNFHCPGYHEPDLIVLSLTGLLCFSMLIYYCGVKKHEKYKHKVKSRAHRIRKEINYDSE